MARTRKARPMVVGSADDRFERAAARVAREVVSGWSTTFDERATTAGRLRRSTAPQIERAATGDSRIRRAPPDEQPTANVEVTGTFDVRYDELTSNCENTGMVLTRGALEITRRKARAVAIDIDNTPIIVGSESKGGRIKGSSKLGKTSIQGLDGRFSIGGTVNADGVLSMVFVAEYYVQGKPYCTQSWNVAGRRA